MRSIGLLLVEDDADLASLVSEQLVGRGHVVTVASTVTAARRVLLEDLGVEILVTDFATPDGDGLSLIRYVRSHPILARLPIVLATGHADAAAIERAASALWAAFVSKPYALDTLLAAMARARELLDDSSDRDA